MNVLEKIDKYLNEGNLEWKPGAWVVQKHDGWNIWMLLINKMKNGGWMAITHTDEYGGTGNASKGSIKAAYPPPVPTTVKEVPAKILAKIQKKQKQLGIKLDEGIRFETGKFEASHGRKPKGTGSWFFEVNGKKVQINGMKSFTDAKKQMKKDYKNDKNVFSITVLP